MKKFSLLFVLLIVVAGFSGCFFDEDKPTYTNLDNNVYKYSSVHCQSSSSSIDRDTLQSLETYLDSSFADTIIKDFSSTKITFSYGGVDTIYTLQYSNKKYNFVGEAYTQFRNTFATMYGLSDFKLYFRVISESEIQMVYEMIGTFDTSSNITVSSYIAYKATIINGITQQEYTIYYELNGGTMSTASTVRYSAKQLPMNLPIPTKSGYIFDGWLDVATNRIITQITTSDIRDYYLQAFWVSSSILNVVDFQSRTYVYDELEKTLTATNLPTGVVAQYSQNRLTNVGSIVVTATFYYKGEMLGTKTATLTITKANYDMSNITFNNQSFTYDGTNKSIFVSGVLPTGVTVSYTGNNKTNAGRYEVVANFTGDTVNYYPIPSKTAILTINKASYDMSNISFENVAYTYDGTLKTIEISGTLPQGVAVTYRNNSLTNAGQKTATAIFTGDSENYNAIPNKTAILTINKATYDMSDVSFENATYTYDGTLKTIEISGTLPQGVSVTYRNNSLTNAGKTTATAIFTGDSINYNAISNMTAILTINKASYDMSNVIFDDDTFVYDGNSKSIYISGTLPQGVTVSYTGNGKVNAGEYQVVANFAGDSTSYNTIPSISAKMYINKATYDMSNVTFDDKTYTYDGMRKTIAISGNLPQGVTVQYTGNGKVNAGEYEVIAVFSGNSNYNSIPNMTANLIIEKATFEEIVFNGINHTYNGQIPTIEIENTLPSEISVSYSGNVTKNVGTYTITASFNVSNNYNAIEPKQAQIKITPAEITFKADDCTSGFGENIKTLTYSTIGTNYDRDFVPTIQKEEGTDVGTYAIIISAVNPNYDITLINGVYTITKGTYDLSNVSFENTTFTFDGAEKELVISGTLPQGVSVAYQNNKLTNVGTTNAIAIFTGDSENYNEIPNMTATLTIEKATYDMSNITFENATYTYNGIEKVVEISGDLPEGVIVLYSNNKRTNVGTSNAVATFAISNSENYNEIPNMTATLTITKATYDMSNITFESAVYTYDGTEKEVSISGALPQGVTVSYTNNNQINAGTYTVIAKFSGDGENYNEISNMTATLIIEKANYDVSNITFESASFEYDGTEKSITINGDLPEGVSIAYTDNTRTNAGTSYAIASFVFDTINYNALSNLTATLTITKATYDMSSITFEDGTFIYNGLAKSIAISGELPNGVSVRYTNNNQINAGTYEVVANFIGDSTNYKSIPSKKATIIIEKATPVINPFVTGDITTDSDISLQYNESYVGELIFDANQTLVVGINNYNWTFTPQDINNYNIVTGKITLTVKAKVNYYNENNLVSCVFVAKGGYVSPLSENSTKEVDGYLFEFSHWSLEVGGSEFDFDTQIEDNTNLYAVYTSSLIEYTITYNLNGGIVAINNPTTYTIESETFTLNNPTLDGFDDNIFMGWIGSNGTKPQKVIAISKGSVGNKEYTAVWYSISDIMIISDGVLTGLTDYGKTLSEIIIPNSVTSIGDSAFSNCSSLNYNTYNNAYYLGSDSNPYLVLVKAKDTSISSCTINTNTKFIHSSAFSSCSSLASIIIPNSVTSIGYSAFSGCSSLNYNTYNNAYYLGSDTNPYLVLVKAKNTSITSCTINSNTKFIHSSAFSGCSSLTSITIPNSVTSIGSYAFFGCGGLTSITIPSSVTSIGDRAFYNCSGLTSITIPNSVTSIGSYAFYYCRNLTSITIPNSVTSIGSSAFYNCSGLTSVTIPNSVTSIGSFAFSGCSGLTSIKIPNSVTSIGSAAFSGCSGLTSITVESGNAVYDSRNNCNAIIKTNTNTLIAGCKNTTIPNSVTSIGSSAFSGCSGLTSITIPNSVTSIGDWAFSSCSGLTIITIPNSVTSIGDFAFSNCSGLTIITIPNSVTSIGSSAFSGCSGLTSITFKGTKAQWNAISKGSSWNSSTGSYTIKCTDGNISK